MTGSESTHDEVRRRAWTLAETVVDPAVFGPGVALTISAHHVPGEPIPPAEAAARPYEPFAVGDAWGPRWGTTWFRLRGRIPAGWAGQEVVLRLESLRAGSSIPGGEYLIFIPSAADGRLVPFLGLAPPHAALRAACAALDPSDVLATADAARAALTSVLVTRVGTPGAGPSPAPRAAASTNGHGAGAGLGGTDARVTAVGHAHIDTAWLWP